VRNVEISLGARHCHVSKAAFFFELSAIGGRARVWKETFFKSNDEHERKLESLRCVYGHERDGRVALVLVLIGNERGVIDKLAQSFDPLIVIIDSGVNEFLQVLESTLGFIRTLAT